MSLRALFASMALLAACVPPAPSPAPRPAPADAPADPPAGAPTSTAPVAAPPAAEGKITVDNVTVGARLISPARITGKAPGTWYFEAVFQAKLIGADGAVIAEAPAQAQSDWMTTGLVPFAAEFAFSVSTDTRATLVLAKDVYGSQDHPDATRVLKIPVVLVAAR